MRFGGVARADVIFGTVVAATLVTDASRVVKRSVETTTRLRTGTIEILHNKETIKRDELHPARTS
jgi:hypothetical protein